MDELELEKAHRHSINNESEIEKSSVCGCFYCKKIFTPSIIQEWLNDDKDDTALCPYCQIDAVIGSSSGYEITSTFLQELHDKYFNK